MSEITDSMFQPVPKPPIKSESYQQQAAEDALAEKPPQRKLPWVIDIFLYPVSKPGLMMLAVFIGVPLFIELLKNIMRFFSMVFPPAIVFFFFVYVFGFIIDVLILLYIYWYLCQCIRSSADGYIRAPDVLAGAPSIGEILWQLMKIILCLVAFAIPAIIYYQYTHKIDTIFLVLFCCAVFLFPMALLSVIMFESVAGLNPLIVIGSIFSTFFAYCLLVLFLGLVCFIAVKVFSLFRQTSLTFWVMVVLHVYILMVTSHLLGRFYYKYQEKLNWDV